MSPGIKPSLRILGFAGSLREKSYNRALLRAAKELAPEGMDIIIHDLSSIPLFNEDVEAKGDPESVVVFKNAINQADALLIASPEYCFSLTGVLKNALDWASRPADASVLDGKPVAIMGASTGNFGSVRGQMILRQTLMYCNMFAVNDPQVLVGNAVKKFDATGRLTDEKTRKFVQQLLEELQKFTLRLQAEK
jgi:chromate reductase, NAD(P)H dehydrogenase (quinone)